MYACFLDASKAFDRVNHSKLFKILSERGVPSPYLRLLIQWYKSQKMSVKWSNNTSNSFSVANGVRQGGNLSPLLFNVYIDDLLHRVRSLRVGCQIGNRSTNVLAYADDIVLLSPSRAGLQKLVEVCELFALTNDIKFNVKKTVCMVFNPQPPNTGTHLTGSNQPVITLNGSALTWVQSFKYLGHVIGCDLGDSGDMRRLKRSLYYNVNMLCALVRHANKNILMKLFRAYCLNFYGCELWNVANNKRAFHELCVAYHSSVKKLIGLPRSTRNHPLCLALGILPCPMLVACRQILFYKRLQSSQNVIIKALLASNMSHCGNFIKVHLAVRQEYDLMTLDLSSASNISIANVFKSRLQRIVSERNDNVD